MPGDPPVLVLTDDEISTLDANYSSWRDSYGATLTQAQIAFLKWLVAYIKSHQGTP